MRRAERDQQTAFLGLREGQFASNVASAPDLSSPIAGYAPGEERPLAGYSVLTGAFATATAGGLVLAHRRRGSLP